MNRIVAIGLTRRFLRGLLLVLLTASMSPAWSADTTTVIVLRHAEKQAEGADPGLTAAGQERARRIVERLQGREIAAVVATEYRRTQDTGRPLAEARKLELIVRPNLKDVSRYARELKKWLLKEYKGKTVVVIGHSNTVPEIVAALSRYRMDPIGEDQFNRWTEVGIDAKGADVRESKY